MISCRQAINCAITAADKAQTLADLNPVRDDLVVAYSTLARAWSSIAAQLAALEQHAPQRRPAEREMLRVFTQADEEHPDV